MDLLTGMRALDLDELPEEKHSLVSLPYRMLRNLF